MTQLLVSVRSSTEAEAALRGGAALIDVKEPSHGSLGRASDTVITNVLRIVAGRRPVSAALGELIQGGEGKSSKTALWGLVPSVQYVKWGLAGSAKNWPETLYAAIYRLTEQLPCCRAVAVAYADWKRAHAPTPEEVCDFAVEHRTGAFLIDTWKKDGSTLLDWLALPEIERLRKRCVSAGVPMALAGSLGPVEVQALLPLRPEWIAVRGAVCRGRRRRSAIDEAKVRQLVLLVSTFSKQKKQDA